MTIYFTDKKETGFYSNVTEKRVTIGINLCALAVLAIGIFLAVGDTSLLVTYPVISMAVAIWFLGFAVHNFVLVMLYTHQK